MNGLKMILFGIALILIGGFFMIDPVSHLWNYGELFCFVLGVIYCIKGLKCDN